MVTIRTATRTFREDPNTTGQPNTYSLDFEAPGMGTPDLYIVRLSRRRHDRDGLNTFSRGWTVVSLGISDGTSYVCICGAMSDNVNTTETARGTLNNVVGRLQDPNSGASRIQVTHNSFVDNGVRLDIEIFNQGLDGIDITVDMIRGVKNASFGSVTIANAVNDTVSVGSLGYTPDVGMFLTTGDGSIGNNTQMVFSAGVSCNDGSNSQACAIWASRDIAAASNPCTMFSNDYVMGQCFNDANQWCGQLSWDAQGFTITTKVGASGGSDIALYCVWEWEDAFTGECKLHTITSPTSAGDTTLTVTGQPNWLFGIMTDGATSNTVNSVGDGYSMFSQTDRSRPVCYTIAEDDGSDPTEVYQAISEDHLIYMGNENAGMGVGCSCTAEFASGSITLSWDVVEATARLGFGLSIAGAEAAPTGSGIRRWH